MMTMIIFAPICISDCSFQTLFPLMTLLLVLSLSHMLRYSISTVGDGSFESPYVWCLFLNPLNFTRVHSR